MRLPILSCLAAATLALPAFADINVRFMEGAPTDRFIFTAAGDCPLEGVRLTIDLSGSSAGLIFDTTPSGAGVEVFQPFVLVAGADMVTGTSGVVDGDQRLTLDVARLDPGAQIAFTIDVDDTIGAREITVSGAEITGAAAQLDIDGEVLTAPFNANAATQIVYNGCSS